jgi:hypothetical protein
VEILQLPAHRSSCHSRPCSIFVNRNSTIAPSLLSLPCRAQLSTAKPQLSIICHLKRLSQIPDWRPFYTSLLVFSSQAGFQLSFELPVIQLSWVWVLYYDRRSVGQSVLVSSTHLGLTTRFLLLSDSCGFVDVGRSLWREDGSAVYNCCWTSPAQSFSGPCLGSSLYSLGADPTENTVSNNSCNVIGGYLAIARISLVCLFVSAGTCLPSSYLATAAVHRITAQQRVCMPAPEVRRTHVETLCILVQITLFLSYYLLLLPLLALPVPSLYSGGLI